MKNGRTRRRQGSLSRLEAQLKSGKKPLKVDGKTTTTMVDLTDKDKKRIINNIEILKTRI